MTILSAVGGEYERDRVVEVGQDLARAYDDELVVFHVMDQDQFEELRGSSEITLPVSVAGKGKGTGIVYPVTKRSLSDYNLEVAVDDARGVAQECVSQTLSEDQRTNITTKGQVGDPATEIIAEAERIDARYIVVGGRKQSPARKAIFGSVSQSVILNSDHDVMTINREE